MNQKLNSQNISSKNIFAIISFVMGILNIPSVIMNPTSVLTNLIYLIYPVIGLIFGIIGLKSRYKKFAIAGLILAIIPFSIILIIIIWIMFSGSSDIFM